jgi:hypothetical protein
MSERYEERGKLFELRAREHALRASLRNATMLLVGPALARLARAASGDPSAKFKNEHELRACIALSRLAPKFIGHHIDDDELALPTNPFPMLSEEEIGIVADYFEQKIDDIPEYIFEKVKNAGGAGCRV